MSDLIERQAAIEALEREKSLVERPITETRWFDLGLGKAQDVISELPSAQPNSCEGCKHLGEWKAEVEYGYPSPCTNCRRTAEDCYER